MHFSCRLIQIKLDFRWFLSAHSIFQQWFAILMLISGSAAKTISFVPPTTRSFFTVNTVGQCNNIWFFVLLSEYGGWIQRWNWLNLVLANQQSALFGSVRCSGIDFECNPISVGCSWNCFQSSSFCLYAFKVCLLLCNSVETYFLCSCTACTAGFSWLGLRILSSATILSLIPKALLLSTPAFGGQRVDSLIWHFLQLYFLSLPFSHFYLSHASSPNPWIWFSTNIEKRLGAI